MKRSVLILLLGLALSPLTSAQDQRQELIFPNNARCGEESKITQLLKEYNEVGFASGKGIIQSSTDNQYYPADIKVYLSNSRSFTITAEMDKGIICILLVGDEFTPIISTDNMH